MIRPTTDEHRVERLRIADLRYNPQRAGFEALVTIHQGGRTFLYPTFLPAPLHAEFRLVASGLTEKALLAHKSGHPGLRLRRTSASSPSRAPLAA